MCGVLPLPHNCSKFTLEIHIRWTSVLQSNSQKTERRGGLKQKYQIFRVNGKSRNPDQTSDTPNPLLQFLITKKIIYRISVPITIDQYVFTKTFSNVFNYAADPKFSNCFFLYPSFPFPLSLSFCFIFSLSAYPYSSLFCLTEDLLSTVRRSHGPCKYHSQQYSRNDKGVLSSEVLLDFSLGQVFYVIGSKTFLICVNFYTWPHLPIRSIVWA